MAVKNYEHHADIVESYRFAIENIFNITDELFVSVLQFKVTQCINGRNISRKL